VNQFRLQSFGSDPFASDALPAALSTAIAVDGYGTIPDAA